MRTRISITLAALLAAFAISTGTASAAPRAHPSSLPPFVCLAEGAVVAAGLVWAAVNPVVVPFIMSGFGATCLLSVGHGGQLLNGLPRLHSPQWYRWRRGWHHYLTGHHRRYYGWGPDLVMAM